MPDFHVIILTMIQHTVLHSFQSVYTISQLERELCHLAYITKYQNVMMLFPVNYVNMTYDVQITQLDLIACNLSLSITMVMKCVDVLNYQNNFKCFMIQNE